MSTRIKVEAPVIRSRQHAEDVMGDVRDLQIQKVRVMADREAAIKEIQERCQEPLKVIDDQIGIYSEQLRVWAEANPSEFGARKSLELTHGTIGWRVGMPKLVKKSKQTWEQLVGLVKDALGGGFIRTKEEVDREAIIAARETLPPAMLRQCGLAIAQEEAFFVEPKMEDVEKRTVVEKGGK